MLKPLENRLIIEVVKSKVKKIGNIEIEEKSTQRAIVVGIGDEVSLINVGDEVIYSKYAGLSIETDGIMRIIIKESDILAIDV